MESPPATQGVFTRPLDATLDRYYGGKTEGWWSMAVITPALNAVRDSLNRRFPTRDKTSDGWIGDEAHQGSRSGHNPDETGNAEYADDDDLDEVRAIDLDDDLRHPDLTMYDVIRSILATPVDRDRVSYMIYDGHIWSRSVGFAVRPYTGRNLHTSHLHISGRPVNDNDKRPWFSIEHLGDDMPTEHEIAREVLHDAQFPRADRKEGQISLASSTEWGRKHAADVKKMMMEQVLPSIAAITATLSAMVGNDLPGEIRAEFDRLRVELVGDVVERLSVVLREEIQDASDDQIEAVIRRVFGSLDESPAADPPVA